MKNLPQSGCFILVVEDEWLIRASIVSQLEDAGFTVIEAGGGEEALMELRDHAGVTTVFSDINMPGQIDGLHLMRVVAKLRPKVQLILTSGRGEPRMDEMPAGAKFLHKPYECQSLTDLIMAA